jgi:hypothetical protein
MASAQFGDPAERGAGAVLQLAGAQSLNLPGTRRAREQRVHAERHDHLGDVGLQIESDLVLALEVALLDAEERDARELRRELLDEGREHVGNRRGGAQGLERREQLVHRRRAVGRRR